MKNKKIIAVSDPLVAVIGGAMRPAVACSAAAAPRRGSAPRGVSVRTPRPLSESTPTSGRKGKAPLPPTMYMTRIQRDTTADVEDMDQWAGASGCTAGAWGAEQLRILLALDMPLASTRETGAQ